MATLNYHFCDGHGTASEPSKCKTPVKTEEIELPSFAFVSFCFGNTTATTASGSYSRLKLEFLFARQAGFYLLQIFVPAALVVVTSWVSFWIHRDSAPSRTTIGITTVLTMTFFSTGTNRRLPPLSYIKASDVYLGFCYIQVVLSMIEYGVVSYTKKKNAERENRRKKKLAATPQTVPMQIVDDFIDARLAECTCTSASVIQLVKGEPAQLRHCVRHSHIDILSRWLFPSAFCIFNCIFWVVLLSKADRLFSGPQYQSTVMPCGAESDDF